MHHLSSSFHLKCRMGISGLRQQSTSSDGCCLLLHDLCLTEAGGWTQCRELWERVKDGERWSKAWAMRAHAAAQRLELSLGAYADSLYSLTQVSPHFTRNPPFPHMSPHYSQLAAVLEAARVGSVG